MIEKIRFVSSLLSKFIDAYSTTISDFGFNPFSKKKSRNNADGNKDTRPMG